jgi:hypothetical protein
VLVATGPMDDDLTVTISGIFLFKVASTPAARRIAEQDPSAVGHGNTIDVHAFLGPAGMGDNASVIRRTIPARRHAWPRMHFASL